MMGFLDKALDVARKGVVQSLSDAAMSAVDKRTSGEDGPIPLRRFVREEGLTGTTVAKALRSIEGTVGMAEVDFFFAGWLVKYGASSGWAPASDGLNGAAQVVFCVVADGRVVMVNDQGELLHEHRPAPGDQPEVKFVNQVTFAHVPESRTHRGQAGLRSIYGWLGPNQFESRDPSEYVEFQGAVVTVPASDSHGPLDMVVLTGELDEIVANIST